MKVFADNLRRRAEALNLSNAEVARRANLEERRYGNYVTGRREPDLSTLLRIGEVLGCSLDNLLRPDVEKQSTAHDILLERLAVAANGLPDSELELVVIQVEALASSKARRP